MKPGLQRIRVHTPGTDGPVMPRPQKPARLVDIALAFGIVIATIYVTIWVVGPFAPLDTLRHLLAFPNCRMAQGVGLAYARVGEPGYWPRHDPDHNGIACEIGAFNKRPTL